MVQAGRSLLRSLLALPRDIEQAQTGCTQQSLRELLCLLNGKEGRGGIGDDPLLPNLNMSVVLW